MMLKYMQPVGNLAQLGSNWRGYDQSFRAVRGMEDWPWDSVKYEMWLNAAHQPQPRVATEASPLGLY